MSHAKSRIIVARIHNLERLHFVGFPNQSLTMIDHVLMVEGGERFEIQKFPVGILSPPHFILIEIGVDSKANVSWKVDAIVPISMDSTYINKIGKNPGFAAMTNL